jgi:hypothetical protein
VCRVCVCAVCACVACGVWRVACGVWRVACGVWLVHDRVVEPCAPWAHNCHVWGWPWPVSPWLLELPRTSSVVEVDSVVGSVVEGDDDDNDPSSVFRRLHEESRNLRAKLKEKRKQIMLEMGETFTPRISERSRQIATLQRSQTHAGERFLQVGLRVLGGCCAWDASFVTATCAFGCVRTGAPVACA